MTSWIKYSGQTEIDFLEEQTKSLLLSKHSDTLIPMGTPVVARKVGYFCYATRHYLKYVQPQDVQPDIEAISKFGLMASPVGADIIIEYSQRSKLFL